MTYDMYHSIFIASTVLCGFFLLISIFLFVKWNIPKVVGEVTGRAAQKAVKEIKMTGGYTTDDLTSVATMAINKTAVLAPERTRGNGFSVECDITFAQSDEIIV